MVNIKKNLKDTRKIYICLIIALGFLLRVLISEQGYMYDLLAHKANADIYKYNGNIFESGQYNYSPLIWINILFFLNSIPPFFSDTLIDFRYKLIVFLTLIDIFSFLILLRLHSLKVASLYYLSPILIFISGWHNQFDNVAILLGLLAVLAYQRLKNNSGFYLCATLLGVSLCAKHTLFFFPLWLAFKQTSWKKKFLITLIPYLIFTLSFAPYFMENFADLHYQVIEYKSLNNYPFWSIFVPQFMYNYLGARNLFFAALILAGLFLQKKDPLETFYHYLILVVLFSSGIANQYLAIPLIGIAVFWNRFYFLFTLCCVWFFLINYDALNIELIAEIFNWSSRKSTIGYKVIIFFLALGYLQNVLGEKKINFFVKKGFKVFLNILKKQLLIKK
jgi:hypothetical protein